MRSSRPTQTATIWWTFVFKSNLWHRDHEEQLKLLSMWCLFLCTAPKARVYLVYQDKISTCLHPFKASALHASPPPTHKKEIIQRKAQQLNVRPTLIKQDPPGWHIWMALISKLRWAVLAPLISAAQMFGALQRSPPLDSPHGSPDYLSRGVRALDTRHLPKILS